MKNIVTSCCLFVAGTGSKHKKWRYFLRLWEENCRGRSWDFGRNKICDETGTINLLWKWFSHFYCCLNMNDHAVQFTIVVLDIGSRGIEKRKQRGN